jgi:hypothetical protein
MIDTSKWPDKQEYSIRDPKEQPSRVGEERVQQILKDRGTEWNGVEL